MDPRIVEHARIIVDHSIAVKPGDEVLITAPSEAEDLAVALNELLGDRGARPIYIGPSSRAQRAFMRAMDPDDYDGPPATYMALAENVDASIAIRAASNTNETSDIPPEKTTAYSALMKPFQEKMADKRWVATQHPAPGNAQDAEMSTAAYADFVYDAVNKDWEVQREFQEKLVALFEEGHEVRIRSGDTTDITMSIDGMVPINDFGEKNLPGGEVFTAPNPDSVEGEVLFDKPLMAYGREVTGVQLIFSKGEVVDYSAGKNQDLLEAVLETDDGARRLGELGFGMNRDIDQFTHNMLFDEKMGDTVHMALGHAIDESIGLDRTGNESAIHMDMIVDMSEDSVIEIDGERIQRNGTFVFEDGF
ncbi:aminopeptidase [Natronosalvus halobius]|uniref:aminopeptidase n=1 Tax=Natronosalvus halobius TaxID=2953746 RepID=UPI00209D8629|nr:aminopeptidase [Natronosalvus halobius]USZ72237.1 aminopeptidase [Natronosalvus halobius]